VAEPSRPGRGYALAGVFLVLSWPLLNLIGQRRDITSTRGDVRSVIFEWAVVAILASIAFGAQRLGPEFLHLKTFSGRDLLYMLGVLIATYFFTGLVSMRVARLPFDPTQFASIPIAIRVLVAITAGVCEEFVFRGFAIEEIGLLTGSRWIGAALSVILFGLAHIGTYGYSTAVLLPATIGLMLTFLYMRRNNLPLCMLMHAIVDSISLLLVPALTNH
jgi:membrane protease YdiL (CAAX protease family)